MHSGASAVMETFNKCSNVTMDVGQVIFGNAVR